MSKDSAFDKKMTKKDMRNMFQDSDYYQPDYVIPRSSNSDTTSTISLDPQFNQKSKPNVSFFDGWSNFHNNLGDVRELMSGARDQMGRIRQETFGEESMLDAFQDSHKGVMTNLGRAWNNEPMQRPPANSRVKDKIKDNYLGYTIPSSGKFTPGVVRINSAMDKNNQRWTNTHEMDHDEWDMNNLDSGTVGKDVTRKGTKKARDYYGKGMEVRARLEVLRQLSSEARKDPNNKAVSAKLYEEVEEVQPFIDAYQKKYGNRGIDGYESAKDVIANMWRNDYPRYKKEQDKALKNSPFTH